MSPRRPEPKVPSRHPRLQAPAHPVPWQRRDSVALALVCAVALLVRVLYLLCLQSSVFFDNLVINAAQYEGWARHGYPAGEPFFQSPLYVTWLRAVFVLSSEASQLLIARLWQILFGTLSGALVFSAARWLAGRLAAAVAGLLAALTSASIYFDLEILPTSLATLLLTATVTGHIGASLGVSGRKLLLWLATALALGLAIVVRPNFLIFLPLFAAHVLWHCKQAATGRWLHSVALYCLVALMPMFVVTAHNSAAGQGFVLLTTSVGDNLLLAHNAQADGLNPFPPSAVSDVLQEYDRRGMNMVQRSAAASELAMQWLRDNPRRSAALWCKKFVLFYNRVEIPNNRSIRQQRQSCGILRVPPMGWIGLALLLPLALAGLAALRQPALRTLLLSLLVAAPLSLMPFLVCARFRAPLIPTLALLAGVAIANLATGVARRRAAMMGVAALLGALIAWPGYYGVQSTEFPRLATNRARLYRTLAEEQRRSGNTATADSLSQHVVRTLEQATQDHPQDATAHLWLADMRREEKNTADAVRLYQHALSLDANLAQAHIGLANIARQQRQIPSAIEHLRAALALRPQDTALTVELAELLHRTGRQQDAVDLLQRQLQRPQLSAQDRQGLQKLLRQINGR